MSIDAAAARREARRRKILENSEKRLTKIITCDNSRGSDVAAALHSISNPWEHCNGEVNPVEPAQLESVSQLQKKVPLKNKVLNSEVAVPDEIKTCDESILLQGNLVPKPISEIVNTDELEKFENVFQFKNSLSSKDKISFNLAATNENVTCDEPTLLSGDPMPNTDAEIVEDKTQVLFWSDCLFIVCVSVIVRLMYSFNMSSMFADSLFVPFVTIFLAKLAANPSKHTSKSVQRGGMLRASLLISGVPKNWLDSIFLCIQMSVDLGHDFALYFFSFTITHIFLESFVNR